MARRSIERPHLDRAHCDACGLCFVACDEGAMALDDQGFPILDGSRCGGCLACIRACSREALRASGPARAA